MLKSPQTNAGRVTVGMDCREMEAFRVNDLRVVSLNNDAYSMLGRQLEICRLRG